MKSHLTDEEITDITVPLTQGAARIKYFQSIGVKVDAKPNGQPLVRRADWDAAQVRAPAANDAPGAPRDWTKLRERVASRGGPQAKRR